MLEENHYYPFGLRHTGYTPVLSNNTYRYKYNGKEVQENGMYDYGARMYMPEIARWGVMDPLAEITSDLSPCHYANNNPVMFNDPTGMVSQLFMDQIWGSASGTTWYNTGMGFSTSDGASMDYDGHTIKWGANHISGVLSSIGVTYTGGGGSADIAGESILPLLWINSPSNISWAWQAQANQQAFAENFNSRSDFAWNRVLNAGRYNDGPVKMIGGLGDPAGIFDIAGQVISNWEPENQYLAMSAGILGAIALKKPGLATKTESNLWRVGAYNEMKGIEVGLDAHHVGQSAIMKRLVAGYEHNTAPTILVPNVGHRFLGPNGIVSRSTKGFTNARQVVARDIFELRRVYGSQKIPNSALQELIQANKTAYPDAFIRPEILIP